MYPLLILNKLQSESQYPYPPIFAQIQTPPKHEFPMPPHDSQDVRCINLLQVRHQRRGSGL